MKNKFLIIIVLQIVLSFLTFPAAFLIMSVFNIDMNSTFISAADGSVGPAFHTYFKICEIILSIIWLTYPVLKLMKYCFLKLKDVNNS